MCEDNGCDICRKEVHGLARSYCRYYIVFEDRVEHVDRERRKRFPGREGQKHPLVCVLYTRETGKVKSIVSLCIDYVVFNEEGRAETIIPVGSRVKGVDKGRNVVCIKDYKRVNLTRLQRELLTIRMVADFGKSVMEYAWLHAEN